MKRALAIGIISLSFGWSSCADDAPAAAGPTGTPDATADVTTDAQSIDAADVTPDLEPVEIVEDVPKDEGAPEPEIIEDSGPETVEDTVDAVDVASEEDAADSADTATDTTGDTIGELPTDNCGDLGIEPHWIGSWTGDIDYDVDSAGLLYPEQGTLTVYGTLGFSISCLDSKFIVQGVMAGEAEVPGFEAVPFELNLSGYYNPETGALNAEITDGAVVIANAIVICFIGDFDGMHDQGTFTGTWGGDATGTNTPAIIGVASGSGDWTSDASDTPPQLPPESEPYECTTPASPPN